MTILLTIDLHNWIIAVSPSSLTLLSSYVDFAPVTIFQALLCTVSEPGRPDFLGAARRSSFLFSRGDRSACYSLVVNCCPVGEADNARRHKIMHCCWTRFLDLGHGILGRHFSIQYRRI